MNTATAYEFVDTETQQILLLFSVARNQAEGDV